MIDTAGTLAGAARALVNNGAEAGRRVRDARRPLRPCHPAHQRLAAERGRRDRHHTAVRRGEGLPEDPPGVASRASWARPSSASTARTRSARSSPEPSPEASAETCRDAPRRAETGGGELLSTAAASPLLSVRPPSHARTHPQRNSRWHRHSPGNRSRGRFHVPEVEVPLQRAGHRPARGRRTDRDRQGRGAASPAPGQGPGRRVRQGPRCDAPRRVAEGGSADPPERARAEHRHPDGRREGREAPRDDPRLHVPPRQSRASSTSTSSR